MKISHERLIINGIFYRFWKSFPLFISKLKLKNDNIFCFLSKFIYFLFALYPIVYQFCAQFIDRGTMWKKMWIKVKKKWEKVGESGKSVVSLTYDLSERP